MTSSSQIIGAVAFPDPSKTPERIELAETRQQLQPETPKNPRQWYEPPIGHATRYPNHQHLPHLVKLLEAPLDQVQLLEAPHHPLPVASALPHLERVAPEERAAVAPPRRWEEQLVGGHGRALRSVEPTLWFSDIFRDWDCVYMLRLGEFFMRTTLDLVSTASCSRVASIGGGKWCSPCNCGARLEFPYGQWLNQTLIEFGGLVSVVAPKLQLLASRWIV